MGAKHPDQISPHHWRDGTETVGKMFDRGWEIIAHCRTCDLRMRVDLRLVILARGRDFSLWNRHPRCRRLVYAGPCGGFMDLSFKAPRMTQAKPLSASDKAPIEKLPVTRKDGVGTLRALLAINQHLNVKCVCGHTARWTALEAVERLGPMAPMTGLARRLTCSVCGAEGRHGLVSAWPCSLDWSAWSAREEAARGVARGLMSAEETLEESLAMYRQLLGGKPLGGDGPVAWPP